MKLIHNLLAVLGFFFLAIAISVGTAYLRGYRLSAPCWYKSYTPHNTTWTEARCEL